MFRRHFGGLTDNATLADFANVTMGQSPAGSSYNEAGIGTIFYQGRAEFGWRYPTQRLSTTEPKRMAKAGDVLMSVRAPVGDLNLAYEDCCIGRGLAAIHCDYPSYGLYLMRSLHKKLDAYNGEGTVFGSINGKALNGLPIALPNNAAIRAFEKEAAPVDTQIRNNEVESRTLVALRDTLLPRLMAGEIDVSKVDLTQLNSHLAAYRPPCRGLRSSVLPGLVVNLLCVWLEFGQQSRSNRDDMRIYANLCESRGEYGLHLLPYALRSNPRDSVDLTGGQAIKAAAKATRRSGGWRSGDILIQLVSGMTGTRCHQLLARARYGRCLIKRVMTAFAYGFRRRTASAELDGLALEKLDRNVEARDADNDVGAYVARSRRAYVSVVEGELITRDAQH